MRKLVRHLVPMLKTVNAGRFVEPSPAERIELLRDKLFEEIGEYLRNGDTRELVDLIEVCFALAEADGWTPADVIEAAEQKIQQRGHLRAPGVMWVVGE